MRFTYLILHCLITLTLCACSKVDTNDVQSGKSALQPLQSEAKNYWWQSFQDQKMNILVNQLLTQNLDIQISQARILEARGISQASEAGLFPQVSVTGNASRGNKQPGFASPLSITDGGFDAVWELDVFGKNQALVDSSKWQIESRIALTDDVVNSVIAELARSMIEWKQAKQTINAIRELLKIQDIEVELFMVRAMAGLIDTSFLMRAKAERSQTAARLPIAQAALYTAEYKIERLLGKKSGALETVLKDAKNDLVIPEAKIPLDISLDSLRQRPDIRSKRAELLAARSDLAAAESELWPRISIRSFFGVQNGSSNVLLASNPIWMLASGITVPLLNFGKLQGAIAASDARAKAAALSYENACLIALQETKTALSDYLNGINAVREQKNALVHRKYTVQLALERFKHGLTNMVDLTTAQSELSQATFLYIDLQTAAATAYVRLHKALGSSVKTVIKTVSK